MYARLSRFAGLDAERVLETVQQFRDEGIPQLKQHAGFRGVTVGVNHRSGQAVAFSFWESEADMTNSEKAAAQARAQAVVTGKPSREPIVDHYEIVIQE